MSLADDASAEIVSSIPFLDSENVYGPEICIVPPAGTQTIRTNPLASTYVRNKILAVFCSDIVLGCVYDTENHPDSPVWNPPPPLPPITD